MNDEFIVIEENLAELEKTAKQLKIEMDNADEIKNKYDKKNRDEGWTPKESYRLYLVLKDWQDQWVNIIKDIDMYRIKKMKEYILRYNQAVRNLYRINGIKI